MGRPITYDALRTKAGVIAKGPEQGVAATERYLYQGGSDPNGAFMSKARPLSLPPSGLSVWRPLSSREGGLVALLGSGPSEGEQSSGEDVQCVWCGLRSRPSAACEVCGSPLYKSVAIWQQTSIATVTPTAQTSTKSPPESAEPTDESRLDIPVYPPVEAAPPVQDQPKPAEPGPQAEAKPRESTFRAFRRFAGLDIRWVSQAGD
jgi:hypothetical protein